MRFRLKLTRGRCLLKSPKLEDDHVVADGNHMLAGQNLKFNVEVVAIREATEEDGPPRSR